ncbi:hypothetical protein ACSHXN_44345 (plasmid) [Streptomyces sp. HUAS TT11]|uniref:hypothetical protein n=1 Tax=Streptomyces sp. HUAS TT11 TaxID=3447508 RepID=UPI003F659DD1
MVVLITMHLPPVVRSPRAGIRAGSVRRLGEGLLQLVLSIVIPVVLVADPVQRAWLR